MKNRAKCTICNCFSSYSDKWDAKYCKECNIWLESKGDCKPEDNENGVINCYFECWNRPERPDEKPS